MQAAGRIIILGALSCLLAACATLPRSPYLGPLPSSQQVIERLEARRLAVRSVEIQGEIQVVTPDDELFGDHLIHGVFPDRLRVEMMGPFGRPVLRLVSNGVRLVVLDYRENLAFVGAASSRNISRFLGLSLSPAEIYALLTGSVPLLPHKRALVEPAPEPGQAQLKLLSAGGAVSQGVVFNLSNFAVRRSWLRERPGHARPGPALECLFSSFVQSGPESYPQTIEISDHDKRRITLTNDKVEFNRPVDGALFEMEIPPGVEIRELR